MNSLPNFRTLVASAMTMLLLFLASCSSNEIRSDRRAELLGMIDKNALIIGAVDPAAVLKSAGAKVDGGEIVLPDNFKRMANNGNKAVSALMELTSAKGVDYYNIVFSASADDYSVVFALTNPDKFVSWAGDKGMAEETVGQFRVLTEKDGDVAVVVDKDIAWLIVEPESAADAAQKVNAKAKAASEKSMPLWMKDCLSKGDAAVVYDIVGASQIMMKELKQIGMDNSSLYNPECKYCAFVCTFDGPSLKISGNAYSADGKVADMLPEGTYETISTKALSLIKDEQLAFAFSLPDNLKKFYASLMNQQGLMNYNTDYAVALASSLDAIKSISFGASLRQGSSIATFKPTDIVATAAVEYDKAASEAAAEKWIALAKKGGMETAIANGWKAWNEDSTFVIAPVAQYPDFKINFTGRDGLALVSTEASIGKTEIRPDASLDNLTAFFSVDLRKDNPILQIVACPFGIKIYGKSDKDSYMCDFTLTDCDGLFLESIINYVSRF